MENTFWTAFGASVLAALVTGIGIYTIRHFEAGGRRRKYRGNPLPTPTLPTSGEGANVPPPLAGEVRRGNCPP